MRLQRLQDIESLFGADIHLTHQWVTDQAISYLMCLCLPYVNDHGIPKYLLLESEMAVLLELNTWLCDVVLFAKWGEAEAAAEMLEGTTRLSGGQGRPLVVHFANPRKMPPGQPPEGGLAPKKLFVGQVHKSLFIYDWHKDTHAVCLPLMHGLDVCGSLSCYVPESKCCSAHGLSCTYWRHRWHCNCFYMFEKYWY